MVKRQGFQEIGSKRVKLSLEREAEQVIDALANI